MATQQPQVVFLMADYGHDPTETAIPYNAFKEAGFSISFATEKGAKPSCDERMLSGLSQKLLGANQRAISLYHSMLGSPALQNPLSWTSPTFSLSPYDLVFLPGGHEKGVRQIIDSSTIHSHLASYFPQTRKPAGKKAVAAICHGVMVLSETKVQGDGDGEEGKSVIHDAKTTALPGFMEGVAYWGTRVWLGDYYKTYGAGSESVETSVRNRLDDPEKQWVGSLGAAPFVVEDDTYNYISGRFPPDADLLAEKAIAMVKQIKSI
ncbi:MAG: hypothetical protein M1827_005411 [Pycnora praestabilis]|nr:MAG: hypothetical protein M1827_005411 [Pycnora praestabilis]